VNTDPFPTDSAEDQASLWAARLEGANLSSADRDQLDAWLNAKPEHRTLLATYCQFSADLEEQLPLLVATGLDSLPAETPANAKPRAFWWLASSGLAAAAAVAIGLFISHSHPTTRTAATAAGQRQTITLDDGTVVELNARTTLTVQNTANARHVQLAEGEAFFTVAKDKLRPFTVETPAGSVRVTGTVFNVRSETPADLDVAVVEGSVQVRPDGTTEPYLLKHNDELVAGGGGVKQSSLSAEQLGDVLAWRDGLVVSDGQPLQDAIARFARYHGRGISVTPAAGKLTIGGRYNLDDLDSFLSDLQQYPVRVTHQPNGTIRVSLRSEP
jgi:transmembrane sensor